MKPTLDILEQDSPLHLKRAIADTLDNIAHYRRKKLLATKPGERAEAGARILLWEEQPAGPPRQAASPSPPLTTANPTSVHQPSTLNLFS